ncbi:MAG: hypothetical protein ACYC91_09765 [Solirubrobacteraceae bacterium]
MGLLICLLAFKWYGVVGAPGATGRAGVQGAAGAWSELILTRWLIVLCLAAVFGAAVLHISQASHGAKTDTAPLIATLSTITSAVLIWRVLVDPPAPQMVVDVKLGGYLGLLCCVGIAVGACDALRHERRRLSRSVSGSRSGPELAAPSRPR